MPTPIDLLELDAAERAHVIVEMSNPGVWVLGSGDDRDRAMGMGIVTEHENREVEPPWSQHRKSDWNDTMFGRNAPAAMPEEIIALTFEIPCGRGGYNRWTINDRTTPDTNPHPGPVRPALPAGHIHHR